MRPLIPLLVLALLLQGCALSHSPRDAMSVYDGVSASYPGVSFALASAAAEELARRYPPAQTTLGVGIGTTDFNRDLKAALRSQGFPIVPSSSIQVGYTLDLIKDQSPPTCYLQVRTSDGEAFGMVRDLSAYSATPPALDSYSASSPAPVASFDLVEPAPAPSGPSSAPAVATTVSTVASSEAKPSKARGIPVRAKAPANRVAKRNKVPVADFCRWNDVTPDTVLDVGHLIYLRDPGPEAIPTAKLAPKPAVPVKAPDPVVEPAVAKSSGSKVEEFKAAAHGAGSAKPVEPASVPVAKESKAEEFKAPEREPGPARPVEPASTPVAKESKAEEPWVAPEDTPAPAKDPSWIINPGSLHGQVQTWAIRAKYRVIWRASHDLEMESNASFDGSFVDAVRQLFSNLHRSGHPLRVTVFQGNNVLEVVED